MNHEITAGLREWAADHRGHSVVVMTGAGISAESGIPTFRGPEGYWTVGSKEFRPEELATWREFSRDPEAVWGWYLYRYGVCQGAEPNSAHQALARWERAWGERFALVTQNVDGLHDRAGHSRDRTFCVHGEIRRMRCSESCSGLAEVPAWAANWTKESVLGEAERSALQCPSCQAWMRPHVLWFDEYYEEVHYRAESAMIAGLSADLLVTVGSSGATQLPIQLASQALARGIPIVDINPEPNPFSELAESSKGGLVLTGTASRWVPALCDQLVPESEAS